MRHRAQKFGIELRATDQKWGDKVLHEAARQRRDGAARRLEESHLEGGKRTAVSIEKV